MPKQWSFSIFAFSLVFTSTSLAHDISTPTLVFLNGMPLAEFLQENIELNDADLQAAFLAEVGVESLTGFASLLERSLPTIGKPPEIRSGTNLRCQQARLEKEQWHLDNSGSIPDGFGKIVKYDIHQVSPQFDFWAGRLDLCSWIGNDEYYFEIKFHIDGSEPMKAHPKDQNVNDPFPGTLDLSALGNKQILLDMMNQWNWKLHAKGDSFSFIAATRNGQDLAANDPLFQAPETNCFDMFFKYRPSEQLPSQLGYCMGRCDARIINTK